MSTIDEFILERAPGPLIEIPDPLVRARAAFNTTLDAFLAIDNDRLGSAWTSAGYNEEVRYGFYRAARYGQVGHRSSARVRSVD